MAANVMDDWGMTAFHSREVPMISKPE